MNAAAFDTHFYVKRLVGAGMTEPQAEAVVDAVTQTTALPDISQLATKDELKSETLLIRSELKSETAAIRSELKSEMAEIRSELRSEAAAIRSELKAEVATLRGEMKGLRGELIWWIIGTGVVGTVAHLLIK